MDVGAGLGAESLLFSQLVGPQGRVIAVEAHPHTYELLTGTVAANQLENVECRHVAVSDRVGMTRITSQSSEMHQLNRLVKSGEGVDVPTQRIDALLREAGVSEVNFLKMNIEGAEVDALRGAAETLRHTRNICVGCHDFLAEESGDDAYRTSHAVDQILADAGFEVSRRTDKRSWVSCYLYGRR